MHARTRSSPDMKDLLKDIALPFALIALALGIGLLFIARSQRRNAVALEEPVGHAAAQLTEKRTHTTTRTGPDAFEGRGVTTHIIEYEFKHPETGKVWTGKATLDPEIWKTMVVDNYYDVIFSEKDPSLSSLFGGEEFKAGAVLASQLGQILTLLGVCGLFLAFWLKRQQGV